MVHLYCGDGKGKTTAAMGLALRMAGSGKRVTVVQFSKDGSSHEVTALRSFSNVKIYAGTVCSAFSWNMTEAQRTQARTLHDTLLRDACAEDCAMLVLDEICAACTLRLIDTSAVKTLLRDNPPTRELVLTGRAPAEYLVRAADYITEMRCVRHPFTREIPAREGIEY